MKFLWTLGLVTVLSLNSLAQPPENTNEPVLQMDNGQSGMTVERTPDGRNVVQFKNGSGSMRIAQPKGSSSGRPDKALRRISRWKNASLTRGSQGELILSDPEEGSVVMERGRQGKTRLQTRDGNWTIDNDILLQFTQGDGRDVLLDQLEGR